VLGVGCWVFGGAGRGARNGVEQASSPWTLWLGVAGLLNAVYCLLTTPATAQTVPPRITQVTPSGGQRGTTVEVTVSGINVGRGTGLLFEGNGLTVESLTPEKPAPSPPPKEGDKPPESPKNPAGKVTARVRIAADAEPGIRVMRVLTPLGPSNIAPFVVDQWPEVAEKEPNNGREQAQQVTFPVTVVGRVDPAEDVDCFRFHASAGQTLVFDVLAARLESPLDSILSIQDEAGHELALNEDFHGLDSFLAFTAPSAGDYWVVLRDVRNSGGSNFTYRLTMGEIPYVTGVFPMGGKAGETVEMALRGFNLGEHPTCRVTLATETGPQPLPRALPLPGGASNPITLGVGDAPELTEAEPNDDPAKAQPLPVPATVNGRIDRGSGLAPADVDCYRFRAEKGQALVLEVMARRCGSALDSLLSVTDKSGKELASNDDAEGKDSRLEFTAPETGDYIARVTDLQERGGPDFTYRLSIHRAVPDFRLSFMPGRLAVGQGGRVPLIVTAERQHGFDDEIALEVSGLPPGVSVVGPAHLRKGRNDMVLVLAAVADAAIAAGPFHVTGAASIDGHEVRREAQGMEEIVRDGERTPRPARLLTAAVAEPPDLVLTVPPDRQTLAPGKTVEIPVKVERSKGFKGKVPLMVLGTPEGVTITAPEIAEDQSEVKITLKAEENAPAGEGDLVIAARMGGDENQVLHVAPPVPLVITPAEKKPQGRVEKKP
jgi:hypothetical protein